MRRLGSSYLRTRFLGQAGHGGGPGRGANMQNEGTQPERSEGNPEKRQRRDAGQPERSEGNPEKRQRRDAGQPERSGGNPEKRQRRDAGQPA